MSNRLFQDYGEAEQYVNTMRTKLSCKVATTQNITLIGEQTIDGQVVVSGDRVLVKDQNTPSQNGIYKCNNSKWFRSTDMDSNDKTRPMSFFFIEKGSLNGGKMFQLSNVGDIDLDTTSLTFIEYGVIDTASVTAAGAVMDTGNETIAGAKTFSTTIVGSVNGNAGTATKLAEAVAIAVAGDVTGSANFDGDDAISITTTLASNAIVAANITDENVTLAKLANMATDSFIGRTASSTGVPEILSAGDARTILNVADGAQVNVATNLTKTVDGDGYSINSSTGNNIALSLADTSNWGLMSDEMFDELVLATAHREQSSGQGGGLATKIQQSSRNFGFSTTWTEYHSNFRTSFVAQSASVYITWASVFFAYSRQLWSGLYDYNAGAGSGAFWSGTQRRFKYDNGVDQDPSIISWVLTGLTVGNTYYVSPSFRAVGGTIYIYAGGTTWPDAIFRIYDGGPNVTVY